MTGLELGRGQASEREHRDGAATVKGDEGLEAHQPGLLCVITTQLRWQTVLLTCAGGQLTTHECPYRFFEDGRVPHEFVILLDHRVVTVRV